MRDYGKVSPQFWIGRTGKALRGNAEAQLLALYLMTSPHANMIGVYHCPVAYMAHETGLTIEGASEALQSLIDVDFCTFDEADEYVFVHQFALHQIGESLAANDKRCKGVENELAKVPKNQCWQSFRARYAVPYNLPLLAQTAIPLEAPLEPLGSQKQKQKQKQKDISPEVEPTSGPVSGFAVPLVDGSDFDVPQRMLDDWATLFPAVDVQQELREMRAWSLANKAKRKTRRGVEAFIVRWLSKAQDTPGRPRTVVAVDEQRSAVFAGCI